METINRKKAKIKKKITKDKMFKLVLVFGPVLFFLSIYLLSGVMFSYTSKNHSRLHYNEKVNGLLNMVKETIFKEKEEPKNNTYLQD
jgi:hypothetical protein